MPLQSCVLHTVQPGGGFSAPRRAGSAATANLSVLFSESDTMLHSAQLCKAHWRHGRRGQRRVHSWRRCRSSYIGLRLKRSIEIMLRHCRAMRGAPRGAGGGVGAARRARSAAGADRGAGRGQRPRDHRGGRGRAGGRRAEDMRILNSGSRRLPWSAVAVNGTLAGAGLQS